MTGEFDYLLKPIRKDAPRDMLRNEPAAFWEGFSAQRKLRKGATLTSPPPTPPERGGGSPRVRIEIEFIDRRGQPPQQPSPPPPPQLESYAHRLLRGLIILLLIVGLLSLLGGCAGALDGLTVGSFTPDPKPAPVASAAELQAAAAAQRQTELRAMLAPVDPATAAMNRRIAGKTTQQLRKEFGVWTDTYVIDGQIVTCDRYISGGMERSECMER
jgi:hypothetical protein